MCDLLWSDPDDRYVVPFMLFVDLTVFIFNEGRRKCMRVLMVSDTIVLLQARERLVKWQARCLPFKR